MNIKNKQPFLIGFFLCAFMVLTIGATYYKQVTGPSSSTDNAILRWDGIRGEKVQNSGITISDAGTLGNGTWSIDSSGAAIFVSASYSTLYIGSMVLTNSISKTLVAWSAFSDVTNYVVDANSELLTITMATNYVVLHATNRPGTSTTFKETQLKILGGTTNWNVTWPTGWRRLGTNITQIPSNKIVWVALVTFTNETDTVFGISKEE